jgi:hypothetical protein
MVPFEVQNQTQKSCLNLNVKRGLADSFNYSIVLTLVVLSLTGFSPAVFDELVCLLFKSTAKLFEFKNLSISSRITVSGSKISFNSLFSADPVADSFSSF